MGEAAVARRPARGLAVALLELFEDYLLPVTPGRPTGGRPGVVTATFAVLWRCRSFVSNRSSSGSLTLAS